MEFGGGADISFDKRGAAGLVTLTRPLALNALTHDMIKALSKALSAWERDDAVKAVVIQAEGKAFSAGGDIRAVYESRNSPASVAFFADEYRLNAQIDRFKKPYVALINGVVMGGGVGVSLHGSHPVMTENAVFAMPEVGIGFFPDVGATYLLPDLGESFGIYLGLTGNRIRYGDALWSGLATYTVEAQYLPGIVERIVETGEPDLALRQAFRPARRETDAETVHKIARHFSKTTLLAIIESLIADADSDEFAATTLKTLRMRSPTSLHVAFKAMVRGSTRSLEECVTMEFRILNRMLAGHDFYEGIRAAIIAKDGKPDWNPKTLEDIGNSEVEAYFAPLDRELTL
ncbi:enoyl-CoA hydratase/isomerase family protein [Mesorhizobium sp. NBSH29]|uniref:enoyl-CoA hydratase/isomerase family protein n=1 Tax=Mesorhizobium sp. NBSH29 TaxID=2654249 RepID=UPI0018965C00|nr:enoyl-CoA hydratase/isomerase family protein [Mesorhizobium sp. NBSH29]QPC88679.1 enoyl-CoA hydratase/isomerase family protein [Mesorhizobium sp. NBSH29]